MSNSNNDKPIKTGVAILLLLCLLDMSYGFYQLVRFVSLIGFSVLAYNANQKEQQTEVIVFIALALLFQPFFKISFGRTLWNIIDVVVAIGLIVNLVKSSNKKV
jgi:hypothetical protein